jgi:preprotein translocase subunit Sec61beta
MAKDKNVRLPSSMAGIQTFTEQYNSRFTLSPIGVFVFIGIVVAFVVLLHIFA